MHHTYPGPFILSADRVWYGFRSFPELELEVVPCYRGRELLPRHSFLRRLLDRLLRVAEARLRSILRRNIVYPNMNDLPIALLNPILSASQPLSAQKLFSRRQ